MNSHRLNVEPITRIRPNPKHRRNTHYGTPVSEAEEAERVNDQPYRRNDMGLGIYPTHYRVHAGTFHPKES